MGSQVALVKGNRQMGFQVDRATHILRFWLKEVARWDLRLTEKKERKKKERKNKRKEKEKRKKHKKKKK
jgi:prophage tail gpP-like protein